MKRYQVLSPAYVIYDGKAVDEVTDVGVLSLTQVPGEVSVAPTIRLHVTPDLWSDVYCLQRNLLFSDS